MHEITAMQGVVRAILAALRRAEAVRVTRVRLGLGTSEHFTEDSVHQAFALLTRGTPVEHAALAIQWLQARYQCLACLHRFESAEPSERVTCPRCGDVVLACVPPQENFIRSIDISFGDDSDNANDASEVSQEWRESEPEITSAFSSAGEPPVSASGKGCLS